MSTFLYFGACDDVRIVDAVDTSCTFYFVDPIIDSNKADVYYTQTIKIFRQRLGYRLFTDGWKCIKWTNKNLVDKIIVKKGLKIAHIYYYYVKAEDWIQRSDLPPSINKLYMKGYQPSQEVLDFISSKYTIRTVLCTDDVKYTRTDNNYSNVSVERVIDHEFDSDNEEYIYDEYDYSDLDEETPSCKCVHKPNDTEEV
jgi:hypothetical protein